MILQKIDAVCIAYSCFHAAQKMQMSLKYNCSGYIGSTNKFYFVVLKVYSYLGKHDVLHVGTVRHHPQLSIT
jgi:hypothetical protein